MAEEDIPPPELAAHSQNVNGDAENPAPPDVVAAPPIDAPVPPEDRPRYRLYDNADSSRTYHFATDSPRDPEPSESTILWFNAQSFDQEVFHANSQKEKSCQCLVCGVLFYVELFTLFLLFIISCGKRNNNGGWQGAFPSVISRVFAVAFTEVVVFVGVYFVILILKDATFLKYSMIFVAAVSVLSLIFALIFGTWGAIGFVVVILGIAVVQFVCFPAPTAFSGEVIQWLRANVFYRQPVVLLVTSLFAVSIHSVFVGYTVYFGASLGWSVLFNVFVLLAYWHTVVVFGQVVYQTVALLFARQYFSGEAVTVNTVLLLQRAFVLNVGTSSVWAISLTVLAPVYFLARVSPNVLVTPLPIGQTLNHLLMRIVYPLHSLAVKAAVWLDEKLKWPNQRGLVYCALFGISAPEGCRRVAELDARFHVNRINNGWIPNILIGVGGLCLEITCGFLTWGFAATFLNGRGVESDHIHIKRTAGAFGFFLCFAFVHLCRMFLAGLVDTLFACFVECPGQLQRTDEQFAQKLEAQYEQSEAPVVESSLVQQP
jgi:hypothetical protein